MILKNKCSLFVMLTLLMATSALGQTELPFTNESEHILETVLQNESDSGPDSYDEQRFSHLIHPININRADYEELSASGLFSEYQVHLITLHRLRFGRFIAVHELQVIDGFSPGFIKSILPFITTGRDIDEISVSWDRMLTEGRQQFLIRTFFVAEEKDGYAGTYRAPVYAGSPFSLYARYRFTYLNKLSFGVTADKDAGEQFLRGAQKNGFDFYSFHFFLRNTGKFKAIAIGDYTLQYGQGLIMSSGFSGGKPQDPTFVIRPSVGIRPYTGSSESGFKRGAAISYLIKGFTADIFYSSLKRDGNLSVASDSTMVFTSFQTSGLHRTYYEIYDRRAITETSAGTHLGYSGKKIKAGVLLMKTGFSLPFQKTFRHYNRFDFSGRNLSSAGVNLSMLVGSTNIFAETGWSNSKTMAVIAGLVSGADQSVAFSTVFRHYPRDYYAPSGGALGESSRNAGETGIFSGITFRPDRNITLMASADRFYFSWLRYGNDAPASGQEFGLLLSYKPARKTEVYVRYRYSQKNENSDNASVLNHSVRTYRSGLRVHVSTTLSPSFSIRSRFEKSGFSKEQTDESGVVIYQDVLYHPMGSPFAANIRYAVFETPGYNTRIYAYENDVLYGFSVPAYYYRGSRINLNVRYRIRRDVDLWLRYAATFYTNRTYIGSGYERIEGNRKSEIKFQLRIDF